MLMICSVKEESEMDRTETVNATAILNQLTDPEKYDNKARPGIGG